MAGLHDCPGLEAERGAVLHGITEEVAGGEFRDAERFGEQGALGALASAGGA